MLNMKDIARSGHVTRWHSVRTARDQTLAEHHYLVAMVSREMAERIYDGNLSDSDALLLLDYALRHDTPELLMGDIPTPLKRRLAEKFGPGRNPLADIENAICLRYCEAKSKIAGSPLAVIVKLADYADAIVFINVEGINEHAKTIEKKLRRLFSAKLEEGMSQWPQLRWAAASHVLDEMLNGVDNQIEFE